VVEGERRRRASNGDADSEREVEAVFFEHKRRPREEEDGHPCEAVDGEEDGEGAWQRDGWGRELFHGFMYTHENFIEEGRR